MTEPVDFSEFRGREIEQNEVRPTIRWLQFGRFVLDFPKIWPPSPWRWPNEDLSVGQIDDWRVQHAVEVLQQEPERP